MTDCLGVPTGISHYPHHCCPYLGEGSVAIQHAAVDARLGIDALNAAGDPTAAGGSSPKQTSLLNQRPRRAPRNPRSVLNDPSLFQLSLRPERLGNREAEHLRGLEIDDQVKLCWLLDWEIGGIRGPHGLCGGNGA